MNDIVSTHDWPDEKIIQAATEHNLWSPEQIAAARENADIMAFLRKRMSVAIINGRIPGIPVMDSADRRGNPITEDIGQ